MVFPRALEVSRPRAKPRSLLAKIHERCWRFSVIARDALARRAPSEQRKNSQTRSLRTGKEQGLRREKGGSKSASGQGNNRARGRRSLSLLAVKAGTGK